MVNALLICFGIIWVTVWSNNSLSKTQLIGHIFVSANFLSLQWNSWGKQHVKRKELFWALVLEVLVCDQVASGEVMSSWRKCGINVLSHQPGRGRHQCPIISFKNLCSVMSYKAPVSLRLPHHQRAALRTSRAHTQGSTLHARSEGGSQNHRHHYSLERDYPLKGWWLSNSIKEAELPSLFEFDVDDSRHHLKWSHLLYSPALLFTENGAIIGLIESQTFRSIFPLVGGRAAKDKVREIVGERRAGWDISGHKMRSHERKGGPQLAASKKMVTLDP